MDNSPSLLQDYYNIIEQCKQKKVEVEADFWKYKERVNLEWSQLMAERDEMERSWKGRDKNTLFGIFHYVRCLIDAQMKGEDQDDSSVISFNNSALTLSKEENSTLDDAEDDMSQESALNHIANFHHRKLISRRVRYQKSHKQRAATLSKLDSLYQDISQKTARPKVCVDEDLQILHRSETLSDICDEEIK